MSDNFHVVSIYSHCIYPTTRLFFCGRQASIHTTVVPSYKWYEPPMADLVLVFALNKNLHYARQLRQPLKGVAYRMTCCNLKTKDS